MKVKKLAAALACVMLAALTTGCMGQIYDVAGTIDGREIPAGLYLMMQNDAYSEAKGLRENTDKDVLSQKIEGQSARSWIKAKTEEKLRRFVLVERMCAEREIVLNDENNQYLEQMASFYESSKDKYEENGIGLDSYMRDMANSMLDGQLFEVLYAKDGERAPDEAELKKQYEEQYAHVRYIMVPTSSLSSEDVDATEVARAAAEEMKERMEKGEAMEDAAADGLKQVYEATGREFTEETATNSISTSYIEYDQADNEDATYSPEFLAALKAQKPGDVGTYEMSSSILVYEKLPTFESDEQFDEVRATVVQNLCRDDYDAYMASLYNAYTVQWVPGATVFLRPDKIVALY